MKWFTGFLFSFLLSSPLLALDQNDLEFPWIKHSTNEEESLKRILKILEGSFTGKKLVKQSQEKAASWGKTLFDVVKVGNNSLTDTTILRRFDRDNALEVIHESVSVVYVNRHLSTYHAVLDLAHELTHFLKREDFNPYVNHFSVSNFIRKTIDGKGGEVEAYLVECQVNSELFVHLEKKRSGCYEVWDTKLQAFSREMTSERFYQLGPYFHNFKSEMKKKEKADFQVATEFPHINKKSVEFYSSAHSVPYPIAAVYEYDAIVGAACKNDQKRMKYIQSGLRKPGSVLSEKLYNNLETSFKKRCQKFL